LVNITPASKQIKIFIAGSEGMVGSALVRQLREAGYRNLLCTSRSDLDLTEQVQTVDFFDRERPDVVVLAAAKVGGILANSGSRADFI
jgi:GDP-L-fucose synthase